MRQPRILCRILIMVLVVSVAVTFSTSDSFAFSGKKKTVYVPTKITTVYDGGSTFSKTIKYNKKGLPKKMLFGNNKMVLSYKYNKKGYLKGHKYSYAGKFMYFVKTKVNKIGLIIKQIDKALDGSKVVYTYKYRKNGSLKRMKTKGREYTLFTYFDKYGNVTRITDTYNRQTYYKMNLDGKGHPVSQTIVNTADGVTGNVSNQRTSYIYDKHGNMIKEITYDSGYTVTTYKYKKVKVAKKYYKFLRDFAKGQERPVTPD